MSKLKAFRMQRNYSCQTLARLLKISKTYYWQVENGKRRLTYDLALKIAEIFLVTPDSIFYDECYNFEKLARERK